MKTINITDIQISELFDMLNKLNEKNLYIYWLIKEKNINLLNHMKESINQILEHYKKQISRMYMLNIIEQDVVISKDTQLNQILESLKNKLNDEKMMDEHIINGLCLSNLDTIFNKDDIYELNFKLIIRKYTEEKNINNKYLIDGINYANSFSSKKKMKKKILNKV